MDPASLEQLEAKRLDGLYQYVVHDVAFSTSCTALARLARQVFQVPIACFGFISGERVLAKSSPALDPAEAQALLPLLKRALDAREALVVEDVARDPFSQPAQLIVEGRKVLAFAGLPIRVEFGETGRREHAVAVLAVFDGQPRKFTGEQLQAGRLLAEQCARQIENAVRLTELHARVTAADIALQRSEAFYHSLVETIPQNIFRKDLKGRFTFANSNFCRSLKKAASEIIGQTDFDLFPAELAAKYQQDDRRVIEKKVPFKAMEQHRDSAGQTLYVQVIKSPLFDAQGRVNGVQGIFWDETDRFKAEEALAYERELLHAMLENIPDSIYFKDRDSRFLAISRSLAMRLGLNDPAEAVGKTDADFFGEAHSAEALRDEHAILRSGQPLVGKTEREAWLDGRERWVLSTKVPLKNSQGEITGTFGISKDITDIKNVEAELASARDAALESARLKSEFLANMSHEIRTPLNGVIGMTGLLLDTRLSTEQRDFAETIRQSADSLLGIINDILDFSKIEAGKMAIEIIDFDLNEVVEGTAELLAEKAQAKGVELASWIHGEAPRHLRGDPGRIRQVLTNLVGNAVKFTQDGEVIIDVRPTRETDQHVLLRFSVKDTGIGIPEEIHGRLFQAFVQADGTTTRRFGGTGLGLAICRQLVELMHGDIGFESVPGQGSTFWFTVPLEKQAQQLPTPAMASTLEGLRVLVVDDNKTNREIVHHQVLSWKMRNGAAEGGRQALQILQEAARSGNPYDIALLDMQMPEMDGLSLARAIKAHPPIAATQLVMLTSLGYLPEESQWREAGISAYLVKPVKESRLYDALVTVLRGTARTKRPASAASPDQAEKPSVRILVAEDNTVNQKVALRQLQKLGYSADAVANGLEVLEAVKRIPYDLILMDCQMPELDGYATTRMLRAQEGRPPGPHHRFYIVAMTANALAGDREECIRAGMDDYISKPVRLNDLEGAISRGLEHLDEKTSAPGTDLLDQEILQSLRDLRTPGESDPLAELVDLFLQDTPARLDQLQAAFKTGDPVEVERAAHCLKGSSNNLGAKCMAATCLEVMEIARGGQMPDSSLIARVLADFERAKPALELEKAKPF